MIYATRLVLLAGAACGLGLPSSAQIQDWPSEVVRGIEANYTEAQAGDYTLPDALKLDNGEAVLDAATWREKRRSEIVMLFEEHPFGRTPESKRNVRFEVFDLCCGPAPSTSASRRSFRAAPAMAAPCLPIGRCSGS